MPGMWEKLFGPGRIDAPEDAAPTELELTTLRDLKARTDAAHKGAAAA